MAIIFRLQPLSFGFLRVSDSWRAPLLWFYLSKVSHFLLPVSFVGTAAQARLKPFPCPGKWPRFICPDATWNQSNCGISIKWYILTSWINKFWLFFGLHQLRGWVWFLHYRPGLFNLNFIEGIFSFGWLVFRGGISANPRITISYFVCICVFLFAGMYSQVLKLYVLFIYENFWLWALEQKKVVYNYRFRFFCRLGFSSLQSLLFLQLKWQESISTRSYYLQLINCFIHRQSPAFSDSHRI